MKVQPPPSPQVVRFAQQPQTPQAAMPMTPTQQPQKQQLKQQPPSKQQVDSSLFVTTPSLRRVLEKPFTTSWLFDVEILARMIGESREGTDAVSESLYELPLSEWRDVAGSKLTRGAYARAASSVLSLYSEYGAMLARQSRVGKDGTTPPGASAGGVA